MCHQAHTFLNVCLISCSDWTVKIERKKCWHKSIDRSIKMESWRLVSFTIYVYSKEDNVNGRVCHLNCDDTKKTRSIFFRHTHYAIKFYYSFPVSAFSILRFRQTKRDIHIVLCGKSNVCLQCQLLFENNYVLCSFDIRIRTLVSNVCVCLTRC